VKPLQPTITVNIGRIEDTKPLDVTCRTTGSRPKDVRININGTIFTCTMLKAINL
jgi:hypothetical protein